MLEVKPKQLINKGILVYQPPMFDTVTSYVNVDIFYSVNDPRLTWLSCDNTASKVFSSNQYVQPNGNMFVFDVELITGFYSIVVKSVSVGVSQLSGSLVVGFKKQPTEPLIIGLPYSIYPPITLI